MTLLEIVTNVFESLGEPSDLDFWNSTRTAPDTASAGWAKLVSVVNTAMMTISTWKWPNGRQVRMRFLEDLAYMQLNPLQGTVSGVLGSSMVVSGLPTGTNVQVGKLVVGGTSKATGTVLWSNGTELMLVNTVGTFVNGETAKVYQREWKFEYETTGYDPETVKGIPVLAGSGAPLDVIGVYQANGGVVLEEAERTERFMGPGVTVGIPTQFHRVPRGFVVDVWPEAGTNVVVRFNRGPKPMTLGDAALEPEVPPQFHFGLVLWGKWWGLSRNLESTDAYAARKDLEDFMAKTRTEYDLQDELAKGQIKIYPEGR